MKAAIITIVVALAALVGGKDSPFWHRIVAAVVAVAIVVTLMLLAPGCQATTYLDGKTYSHRFDILTPIGQTANGQAPYAPKPIIVDPNK